jgi:hypothetical protein
MRKNNWVKGLEEEDKQRNKVAQCAYLPTYINIDAVLTCG